MADEATETTAAEKAEKAPFQIFGSVDLNDSGQVRSYMPSWYFDHLKDGLVADIERKENALRMDRIPRSEIPITQERLQQQKAKLKALEQSTVELRGKKKDVVVKVQGELGEKISEAMFTRNDMMKGLANPHEEVRRMTEPCIEVRGDALNFVRACNVKVVKGKVTREGAAKAWKIASKAIGEASNVERLRRDQ